MRQLAARGASRMLTDDQSEFVSCELVPAWQELVTFLSSLVLSRVPTHRLISLPQQFLIWLPKAGLDLAKFVMNH
jgi:hypothetical protein